MMKYIYSNNPIKSATKFTAKTLKEHLQSEQRVLWLLTGGSGATIAVEASKELKGIDLSNLFVTMTDERYGKVGHHDENWQQILNAGLQLPGATLYRPLIGKNVTKTTKEFEIWLSNQFDKADYVFAIFGIGNDGHTAGIKPNSKAVSTKGLTTSFVGEDFERITISLNAVKYIDEAVVQVAGPEKRSVLRDLLFEDVPISDQPAQILKSIPSVTIYTNNHKKELIK